MCRSSRAFGHSPHQAPFASDETRCTFPCLIGTMELRDAAFGKMAIRGERLFDRSVDRKFLCGLPGAIAECGQLLARQCGQPPQGCGEISDGFMIDQLAVGTSPDPRRVGQERTSTVGYRWSR